MHHVAEALRVGQRRAVAGGGGFEQERGGDAQVFGVAGDEEPVGGRVVEEDLIGEAPSRQAELFVVQKLDEAVDGAQRAAFAGPGAVPAPSVEFGQCGGAPFEGGEAPVEEAGVEDRRAWRRISPTWPSMTSGAKPEDRWEGFRRCSKAARAVRGRKKNRPAVMTRTAAVEMAVRRASRAGSRPPAPATGRRPRAERRISSLARAAMEAARKRQRNSRKVRLEETMEAASIARNAMTFSSRKSRGVLAARSLAMNTKTTRCSVARRKSRDSHR
jgi:hypothetical protein